MNIIVLDDNGDTVHCCTTISARIRCNFIEYIVQDTDVTEDDINERKYKIEEREYTTRDSYPSRIVIKEVVGFDELEKHLNGFSKKDKKKIKMVK